MQVAQQRQPVVAQRNVVGVDHHAIEERIDRRAQRSERAQRRRVVALRKRRRARGSDLAERLVQRLLLLFLQQCGRDRDAGRSLALLEDVADALVGRSERRGLGQRRKRAHCGETLLDIGEALRAQRNDRVDFLRRVAAFLERERQPVEHELLQRRARVLDQRSEHRHREVDQFVERQVELLLRQHADRAERMATKRERVLVARRQLADAEQPDQRLDLVGERHRDADRVARQLVAGEARLVVVLDRVCDRRGLAVLLGVVASHDALQLGELADHVGEQVGLRQVRSVRRLLAEALAADAFADLARDRAHALDALALRAELVVVDDLLQARSARGERLLLVLLVEEASVRQARTHDALVALYDRARVVRTDVADDEEALRQPSLRVEQREVLLVELHRQDEALLRHREELLLEAAQQHIGTLDERRHFLEQRVVVDRSEALFLRLLLQLARDLLLARGKRRDHGAVLFELLRVGVGRANVDARRLALEAMAHGRATRDEPKRANGHDLAAVQRHESVRWPHELDAGPAVLILVGHHLGDRQLLQRLVDRLLQRRREFRARDLLVEEQRLGLAVDRAHEARHHARVGAECSELLLQHRRRLAVRVETDRNRHELLPHHLVGAARSDLGHVRREAARRRERRSNGVGGAEPLCLQAVKEHGAERLSELLQGLRRQFLDEQFYEQALGHGGARSLRTRKERERVRARTSACLDGDPRATTQRPFSAPGVGLATPAASSLRRVLSIAALDFASSIARS